MSIRVYSIGIFLFFSIALADVSDPSRGNGSAFQWPGGAKAAVCLTYDDGLDVHLDIVQPDLAVHGFHGTFYCTGNSPSLSARMEEWRALIKKGHELGNHSLYHPCIKNRSNGQSFDWVKPEYDLGKYTVAQMANELSVANVLLKSIDGKNDRTYAYTCSDTETNGQSFVDAIRPMFTGARKDGPIPRNMQEADLHVMPSWAVGNQTGSELINYVKEAAKHGTIATFMFHGVGGGHSINVTREAHRELLEYLAANRDTYWVDTFIHVADHIKKENQRVASLKK